MARDRCFPLRSPGVWSIALLVAVGFDGGRSQVPPISILCCTPLLMPALSLPGAEDPERLTVCDDNALEAEGDRQENLLPGASVHAFRTESDQRRLLVRSPSEPRPCITLSAVSAPRRTLRRSTTSAVVLARTFVD